MSVVLVTGGTGFVGSHVVLRLLRDGHTVRTTVRSLKREPALRAALRAEGVSADDRLSFYEANLERHEGWAAAAAGCDFVMHVASPIPSSAPKNADDLIIPARDGTLRVLKAARDAGVKRVVFTSSCGAVYYGHPLPAPPFDETSWTNLDGEMSDYVRSKAIAERAAWDWMEREGGSLELSVINPTGIFGPIIGNDVSSSVEIIGRLLKGMPACPRIYFAVVDVRDVADMHVRAMTNPNAAGQRFIASGGPSMSMFDVAKILRARLGAVASKVPTREIPDWVVRIVALFNPQMRNLLPLLGKIRNVTTAKAERVLGWKARPVDDTLAATAESLLSMT